MKTVRRMVQVIKTSQSLISRQHEKLLPRLHYFARNSYGTHSLPVIYMFTKDNCSLYDKAKATLEPYRHRFELKEVDITKSENKEWFEQYQYDIPVFHMAEKCLFKHKVDLDVLENALKEYENNS